MRRVLILFCLSLSSLFLFSSSVQAGGVSLGISGGGSKTIGDTFNMSATLGAGGNKVCVINFTITYPADLLELKSSSLGSPFSMTTEQSSSAGTIHYQVGAPCSSANASADATILNMSFSAKAAGDATVAFSVGDVFGGDKGDLVIDASKGSATVSITAKKVTPKKTTTTTPAATPAVTIKDPTFSAISYASDAVLDDPGQRVKGIVFSGTADPDAKINIVIASDPITAATTSDASGNWTYTLTEWLPTGVHKITINSEKSGQKSADVTSNFVVGSASKEEIAIGTVLPVKAEAAVSEPTTNTQSKSKLNTMTIAIIGGGLVGLLVLVLLVIFLIKRKRYLNVAKEISGSIQPNQSGAMVADNSELSMPTKIDLSQSMSSKNTQPAVQSQNTEAVPTAQSVQNQTSVNLETVPVSAQQPNFEVVPLPEQTPRDWAPQEQALSSEQPASNQIANVKPDGGEITVGYTQNPQEAHSDIAKEVAEATKAPAPKASVAAGDISGEPEITFDDEYIEEAPANQNNSPKSS